MNYKILLFNLLLIVSVSAASQNGVVLRFDHKIGSENLVYGKEYSDLGYDFNIQRLEYYLGDITITHDGGQETYLDETWLLVNAGEQNEFYLGDYDIDQVESITFGVGVDSLYNHLDPTLYPPEHPLAPQNPSMHWGWVSGYRFVCLEGFTGFGMIFNYQIHALGNENYHLQTITTANYYEDGNVIIPIHADYNGMYDGIDVSGGLIEHGENGPAKALLDNFASKVFSQMAFTGTDEMAGNKQLNVYPNPSNSGKVNIVFETTFNNNPALLVITDMTGREIYNGLYNSDNGSLEYYFASPGMYFVKLLEEGRTIANKKVVVTN